MLDIELSIFHAFIAGVLTSFTPCVYPLIPITLALFGASEQKSRLAALSLALCYVLGIAFTYTGLGILSALTGSVFGNFLANTYALAGISLILFYLYLVTMDLANVPFLSRIQQSATKVGGKGYFGAFVMGLVCGVVAAPCVGPVLAEILLFAAKTQDVFRGAQLLFSYAFGFGLIFIIIATFADLANHIPKAGNWIYFVKFIIATSLLMVIGFLWQSSIKAALFPLGEFVSKPVLFYLVTLGLVLGYLFSSRQKLVLTLLTSFLLAILTFQLFFPSEGTVNKIGQVSIEDQWYSTSIEALNRSKELDQVLMVDFYADWCLACKELEEITFADPKVIAKIRPFIKARIDYEKERSFVKDYGILGLPTILFLDSSGKEIKGTRINGFVDPQEFIRILDKNKL